MQKVKYLLLVIIILVPTLALADLPEQLKKDFAPLDGYVVMQLDNEYLIDLDAAKGLREGDVFSLIVAGKKIVHPVTNEVIGTLDSSKGFLRVTRVKNGYSYAHLLPGSDPVKKGDPIRRFDQVPAYLKSDAAVSIETVQELKTALPQFEWLAAESGEIKPLVVFELANQSLTVKAGGGRLLNSYSLAAGVKPVAASTVALPTMTPVASGVPVANVPVAMPADKESAENKSTSAIIRNETQSQEGIWFGPNIDEAVVGVATADVDGDGSIEIIVATEETIIIGRKVGDEFQRRARISVPGGRRALAIDGADLDGDGRAEVAVSAFQGGEMSSFIIGYVNGGYQLLQKDLPWHFRAINIPGEGLVLLGQEMDQYKNYADQPFRVSMLGQKLAKGAEYPIPDKTSIYSVAPFADPNGETVYAYLTKTDYLKIADGQGEILWESADYLGGTEIRFERMLEGNDSEEIYFVRPRIRVGTNGEIMVSRNEGHRVVERYREFKEGQLVAMQWNGLTMLDLWKTALQNGYLADFSVADIDGDGKDELVTVYKFAHKGLFSSTARSAIVVYEIQ